MKRGALPVLIGLWLFLGVLVVLWKTFPSPIMNVVFHAGWISMFLTGGIWLYRNNPARRRR